MYVRTLELHDFRSWENVQCDLNPGITIFAGPNGNGKTNIVEALGYLAHLESHRVSQDFALVRENTPRATISARVVNNARELETTLIIPATGTNQAWINRAKMKNQKEILGIVKTTLFAPEDLSLIRGEPEIRRNFIDDILISTHPRYMGVKSDYEKVLKQRNSLLKSSQQLRQNASSSHGAGDDLVTLDVWTEQLAFLGGQLMAGRVEMLTQLRPYLEQAYARIAPESRPAHVGYISSIAGGLEAQGIHLGSDSADRDMPELSADMASNVLLSEFQARRDEEIQRGRTLLGPHRDDLQLMLGTQPAKGYASHGESWSYALALRLSTYLLQKQQGIEPIIILDDVFAELDDARRRQIVGIAQEAEQVLITAAVASDIPPELQDSADIFQVRAEDTPRGRISSILESNQGGDDHE